MTFEMIFKGIFRGTYCIAYGLVMLAVLVLSIIIIPFVTFISLIMSKGDFEVFKKEWENGCEALCPPLHWFLTREKRRIEKFMKDVRTT